MYSLLTTFLVCIVLVGQAHSNAMSSGSSSEFEVEVDNALYDSIKGEWQGALQFQSGCNPPEKSCSFQVDFLDNYVIQLRLGTGCYKISSACMSEGTVTSITEDTISFTYPCTSNNRGCYCYDNNPVSYCWKYTKPSMMSLNIGLHLEPAGSFPTCPLVAASSCNNDTNENVGLGVLGCTSGDCMVCRSETTCSGRGTCDLSAKCNCFPSFHGPNCNVSACPNVCSEHGLCDISKTKSIMGMYFMEESSDAGICRCFSGWAGDDCSSADIYSGRQALWEGLVFVGVVSTVVTVALLLKKFSRISFHRRSSRRRRRRHLEVELDEFINPL